MGFSALERAVMEAGAQVSHVRKGAATMALHPRVWPAQGMPVVEEGNADVSTWLSKMWLTLGRPAIENGCSYPSLTP